MARLRRLQIKRFRSVKRVRPSGHDDFVLEAAGGEDEQYGAHGEKGEGVDPEMLDSGAAEDDAASDVDEIAGGDEIAEDAEEQRHGFAREDVTGKENAGQDGDERKLHGFALGACFAGDENAERQRHEDVGERKKREQQHAAVDGHLKNETHAGEN